MKSRRLILLFLLLTVLTPVVFSQSVQKKISILGDSYSTFYGYVTPDTNACWYGIGEEGAENDVKRVEETWWYPFISEQGFLLECNNSYSGSTICHTGYNKQDFSDRSFITRMNNLGNPDIILIFGGTNDTWAGVPLGEFQYSDWNQEDLYNFRSAFCYLLDYMTNQYPEAEIYNITNTELSREVSGSMDDICKHYGITNIRLRYIDKQSGHPSISGMRAIYNQVGNVILKNNKETD
ncbi:MAG: SGNH/GDSL hydrolase family protein [Tannerellaceae bacterium]|nr:SGNH/GDSL hydrolase family protein [Tannerellaceae bacterium]